MISLLLISIFISVDGLCTGNIPPLNVYSGPSVPFEKMVNGFDVLELGLTIAAGPSTMPKAGMGMFICCDEYTDEVLIPGGTVVCGYSNSGVLKGEADGDKTVAYYFDKLDQGCVFQKHVMSLREVLNDTDGGKRVLGHSFDPKDENKFVIEDISIKRHFVPAEFDPDNEERFSPQEMGVFVNDLGFGGIDTSEESYRIDSDKYNILELVWRLEQSKHDAQLLIPTYPVIITTRDVLFNNYTPMEVGLSYGFRYWKETMLQQILSKDC